VGIGVRVGVGKVKGAGVDSAVRDPIIVGVDGPAVGDAAP
jgi:hypothetical protein